MKYDLLKINDRTGRKILIKDVYVTYNNNKAYTFFDKEHKRVAELLVLASKKGMIINGLDHNGISTTWKLLKS